MPSKKIQRICETCGAAFLAVPAEVKLGRARFCTRSCYWQWMTTRRGEDIPTWKGGISSIDRQCEHCGIIFITSQASVNSGHGRFCSRKCKGEHQSALSAASPSPKKISCTCNICDKKFFRWPSTIKRNEKLFCSYKCWAIYRAQNVRGQNHWHWKGGSKKYPTQWAEFLREEIRERDGRKCSICGRTETENRRKLDVHHIDYDKSNLSPDNLISLCNSCHPRTNFHRDEWRTRFVAQLNAF